MEFWQVKNYQKFSSFQSSIKKNNKIIIYEFPDSKTLNLSQFFLFIFYNFLIQFQFVVTFHIYVLTFDRNCVDVRDMDIICGNSATGIISHNMCLMVVFFK